jgi:hypothetical protein
MPLIDTAKRDRIRELNDAFGKAFDPVLGRVVITAGVDSLSSDMRAMAIRKTTTFDAFTPDNDPDGEHDFGGFELAGERFFWKIDLYEEPGVKSSNGEKTITRNLTIMLAEEY